MLYLFLTVLFVTANTFECTRVSRIKPAFHNYPPDALSRPPDAALTPNSENTKMEELSNRYPTTLQAVVRTYHTTIRPSSSQDPTNAPFCEKPYSCINCTTFRLCVPSTQGFLQLYSGSCPADRPYCDSYSGTCVNSVEAAVQCGTPDDSFHCMHDGYFPHAEDPTKYFICSKLKAYPYSCKDGYKYYAPSQECNNYSWISNPFDCSQLNATKVVYNSGGSFFAYCINGRPYTISKCPDSEFFNVTSQVCEPQCYEDMVVPDSNNCLKYFQCYKNNETNLYEKVSNQCPKGEGFSKSLNKCISVNHLTDCEVSS